MLGVIAREREEEIMLCAARSFFPSFSCASRRPFLVNPQKEMKRERERESGAEWMGWRSLSQFAEYDVGRVRDGANEHGHGCNDATRKKRKE